MRGHKALGRQRSTAVRGGRMDIRCPVLALTFSVRCVAGSGPRKTFPVQNNPDDARFSVPFDPRAAAQVSPPGLVV